MDAAVRFLRPYAWGLLAVVALSGIKVLVGAVIPSTNPYLFYIVGVLVVAYNLGFGPGLVTTLASALVAELVFARYTVLTPEQPEWQRVAIFLLQALPVCYICGVRIKTALDRNVALEAEREARMALASTSQELIRSEERYRGMIAAVPQIVFVCDAGFQFEWINDRWEGLTGSTEATALGQGWLEAVQEDDRPGTAHQVTDAIAGCKVLNVELRLVDHASGSYRWHLVRAVPLLDQGGRIAQWIGTFTDVHDSKLLINTMQELNEELESHVRRRTDELVTVNRNLEAANSELEAFCYAVSHDLRTPLRAIDGFSHALSQDYGDLLPDDGRGYLERVRLGARRMDELITSLLKLSRIARQELAVQEVDVSEIVHTAWGDLGQAFKEHPAKLSLQPGLTALADPKLLRIVFDNLLGNALKFTMREPAPCVEVGVADTARGRAIFVRDNGVGFSMEYANKLFVPFERLHSPREFPGSGIGLATVMRCVRKHGGEAWADSAEGEGATFYFTLEPAKA